MNLKLIKCPELFQGRNKTDKYFEGWYFKNVSADLKNVFSVIPGVSIDTYDKHAFIQTIIYNMDSDKIETNYHKFTINDFKYTDDPFSISIGSNKFSCNGMELDLHANECYLHGKINFSKFTKIKTNLIFPNTMGFFAYIPFMECYHEIVSMNHNLKGSIIVNEETLDFNKGKGYVEKDWGTSFPRKYIWIQSNNFKNSDASIMCSVAHIPFLASSFNGFICNLIVNGLEYRFASYNLSKLKLIENNNGTIKISIKKNNFILNINGKITFSGGMLKAPKSGLMNDFIKEGLNGKVSVKLTDKSGKVLFDGTGNYCGIEVVE
mgnify:CR=1 FL=1